MTEQNYVPVETMMREKFWLMKGDFVATPIIKGLFELYRIIPTLI
jgi:hypothetical protein